MEALVAEEVERLCQELEETKGEPLQMRSFFNKTALRALWRVITSEDLLESKHDLRDLWRRQDALFSSGNSPMGFLLLFVIPSAGKFLNMLGYDTFMQVDKDFGSICSKIVAEHEQSYQEESVRDFTDMYIKTRQEHASSPGTSFHGSARMKNQRGIMIDIMQAGTDTTSVTMEWAILLMIKHPDIAKQVQRELDSVTGRARLPCWADRLDTPFTEAAITEVQRCASIVPNGVPRVAKNDTKICGYDVPKGTQVWANLDYLLKDPKAFPNPTKFDPERHMKDGKYVPHPQVIVFGYGKRRCLGETLARMELYRIFTGIMHHFDLKARPGDHLEAKSNVGSFKTPKRYHAIFSPRQ